MGVDPKLLSERFAPLISAMKPEDLARVAGLLEPRQVPASTRLIARGEPSDAVYLVVEGSLEITLDCRTTILKLATREEGDWVGELGLIDPGPASAHVDAAVDSTVWVLTHDDYVGLLAEHPMAAASFTEMVCRDVAKRLRQCDTLTFHREGDGGVLAVHPEEPKEGLLGHLQRLLGRVRS